MEDDLDPIDDAVLALLFLTLVLSYAVLRSARD